MEDISKLRQYASILMHERKKLEEKILRAKPYIEGSLIKRYTRCGKPGCRCMEGKPHGPFWYLSRRIDGKTRYTYIPKDRVKEVKALTDSNKEIRNARAEIRKITERLDSIFDQIVESQLVEFTKGGGKDD
ncbi:MAG: hypothetical protein GX872_04735 [Firmicutes bacterium]|nr:hypothetical protein [Bacillota bacterium]